EQGRRDRRRLARAGRRDQHGGRAIAQGRAQSRKHGADGQFVHRALQPTSAVRCLGMEPTKRWKTIMARALAQFTIIRTGEDYLLTIEDQDGDTTEFTVDYDQLDLITEAIEEQLDADEEDALEPDDDAEEPPEGK